MHVRTVIPSSFTEEFGVDRVSPYLATSAAAVIGRRRCSSRRVRARGRSPTSAKDYRWREGRGPPLPERAHHPGGVVGLLERDGGLGRRLDHRSAAGREGPPLPARRRPRSEPHQRAFLGTRHGLRRGEPDARWGGVTPRGRPSRQRLHPWSAEQRRGFLECRVREKGAWRWASSRGPSGDAAPALAAPPAATAVVKGTSGGQLAGVGTPDPVGPRQPAQRPAIQPAKPSGSVDGSASPTVHAMSVLDRKASGGPPGAPGHEHGVRRRSPRRGGGRQATVANPFEVRLAVEWLSGVDGTPAGVERP